MMEFINNFDTLLGLQKIVKKICFIEDKDF
jgi:hypothetical protein